MGVSRFLGVMVLAAVLITTGCGAGEQAFSAGAPEQDAALADLSARSDERAADAAGDEEYESGRAEGVEDGAAAGQESGHDDGYADAERGAERGTSEDSEPDETDVQYDPEGTTRLYLDGYAEGYREAYSEAYETAYDEGYDGALADYGNPTVENPYDKDCSAFGGPVAVSADDPNHLDQDGDGVGCESG